MIDLIGELKRLANKDAAETFDQTTDSLEALRDYLAAFIAGDVATILALLNAILVLTETGGTVTTDGAEQDVYINNAPAGVFSPKKVKIDFTNQTAAETVIIRYSERFRAGGGWILIEALTFAGVQTEPGKYVELEPNRFGVRVTMERTAGGAIDYDWEALYKV